MVQVDKTSVLLAVAMAFSVLPTPSVAAVSSPSSCVPTPIPYPFKGVVGHGSRDLNAQIINLKDCYVVHDGRLVSCITLIHLKQSQDCWVGTYNDELSTKIPSKALSGPDNGEKHFLYCGDISYPESSQYKGLPKDFLIQMGVVSYGASRTKKPLPDNKKAHVSCHFQTPYQMQAAGIPKEYRNSWKFTVAHCALNVCDV